MRPNGSSSDHFEQVIDLGKIEGDKQLINLGLDLMTDGQTGPPSAPLIAFEENANKGLPGESRSLKAAYTWVLLLSVTRFLILTLPALRVTCCRTKIAQYCNHYWSLHVFKMNLSAP